MKKSNLLLALLSLLATTVFYAQVGIGTTTPKTTLQVQGNPENTTTADGIQVPVLSLEQLEAKITAYGSDQNGAIIYIDNVSVTGSTNTATANISTAGYYFYDATNLTWKAINSGISGNTRSLQTDLLLTSTICNCSSLPPAMIESLLNNGYTNQDLIDFQIPAQDLLDGGLTIQELFDAGQTPIDLYNGGVPLNMIYGNSYNGGLIFYLDTESIYPFEGLVAAANDQSTGVAWGCSSIDLNGDDNTIAPELDGIGNGQANTSAIVNLCTESGIAAKLCNDLVLNGYSDWFLPSRDELNLMYQNIGFGATASNENIGNFSASLYWSSSERDASNSWVREFAGGFELLNGKIAFLSVRAVRAF